MEQYVLHLCTVSVDMQVRALRTTAALCTMLLSQWSSLPQEDQQTLSLGLDSAGQPLSDDMKLAIQFRLQKKSLLLQAVNKISKQIQVKDPNLVLSWSYRGTASSLSSCHELTTATYVFSPASARDM